MLDQLVQSPSYRPVGFPRARRAPSKILPLPDLSASPRSGGSEFVYGLKTLDGRGRIVATAVVSALDWQPDDRLGWKTEAGVILISRSASGTIRLAEASRFWLPSRARRRARLRPGDQVLLAGHSGLGVLLVISAGALDSDMLARSQRLVAGTLA